MGGYGRKPAAGFGVAVIAVTLLAAMAIGRQASPRPAGPDPVDSFVLDTDSPDTDSPDNGAFGSIAGPGRQAPLGPESTAPSQARPLTGSPGDPSQAEPDATVGPIGEEYSPAETSPEPNSRTSESVAEAAATPTVLRLIYFVEADQEFDPQSVDAIDRQALALQTFWYEQFGGTFRLPVGGVEVVYGDQPADWYADTPDGDDERWYRLMNIRTELRNKLSLDPDAKGTRLIVYPHARRDGRVGANRYEGAWMDGDDIGCITGTVETTPYTPDFPANCLATVAHELGHVYGLGHEGANDDCMQFGFYHYASGNQLCDFSPENRDIVVSDPRNQVWLDAAPGDRG